MPKSRVLEKDIQKSIIDYLEILEKQGLVYFVRANSFAGSFQRRDGSSGWIKNNKAGCPDIITCIKGRFVGLEVKTPNGRQSDHQKNAEKQIKKAGGEYYIVRDIDDVINIIATYRTI